MDSTQFRAMNTDIVVMVEGNQAEQAFEMAAAAFAEAELRFSRFIPDSELSRLNQSAGQWFTASPHLLQVLTLASEYHQITNGLFNPLILPALESAGYAQSFERLPAQQPHLQHHTTAGSLEQMQLDAANSRVMLPAGTRVDLGGIAKGWTSEQTARMLAKRWPCVAVNAGGDMFLIGQPADGQGWTVSVQDPFNPQADLLDITTEPGAVATSSVTVRKWQAGSESMHHIIDPRTGAPAQTHWAAVTVLASAGAQAEAYAKALLIGGEALARDLDDAGKGCPFVAIGFMGERFYYEKGKKYDC